MAARIAKTSSGEDERTYMRGTWTVDSRTERREGKEKIEDKGQTETEDDAAECRDEIGRDGWLYIEEDI